MAKAALPPVTAAWNDLPASHVMLSTLKSLTLGLLPARTSAAGVPLLSLISTSTNGISRPGLRTLIFQTPAEGVSAAFSRADRPGRTAVRATAAPVSKMRRMKILLVRSMKTDGGALSPAVVPTVVTAPPPGGEQKGRNRGRFQGPRSQAARVSLIPPKKTSTRRPASGQYGGRQYRLAPRDHGNMTAGRPTVLQRIRQAASPRRAARRTPS